MPVSRDPAKGEIDCIALKREAALRIYQETKDMTLEEELAYWQKQDDEMFGAEAMAQARAEQQVRHPANRPA